MTEKMTIEDFDKFLRQLKILIRGVLGLIVVPLIIYAVYLDRRLDHFQATLQHSPPEELEANELTREDFTHFEVNPVVGQRVYVPAYSHVYHGDGKPYLLTVTLSIRNTSLDREIVVKSVKYFDTKGKAVKSYLDKPVRLPALGTTEIVVKRDDSMGGSGANFLVDWYSENPVTEPIIETVMIDTSSQQGISFVRRGSVISEFFPAPASDDH